MVDPKAVLLGGGLLGAAPPTREVVHSVVGAESVVWNDKPWDCFVVEDRHGDTVGKTWVRRADGAVLRQQASLGFPKRLFCPLALGDVVDDSLPEYGCTLTVLY